MHHCTLTNEVFGTSGVYACIVAVLLRVLEGKVKYFLDFQIIPKKRFVMEQKFRNILFQRRLHDQHNYTRVLLDVSGVLSFSSHLYLDCILLQVFQISAV